jgi:hypothetical protein
VRKIHFVKDDDGLDQMCATSSGNVRMMSYAKNASAATACEKSKSRTSVR